MLLASASAIALEGAPRYRYTGDIAFDIERIPFSGFGSDMAFSYFPADRAPRSRAGVFLRTMRSGRNGSEHPVFGVELLKDGSPVACKIAASPTLLRLISDAGDAEFFFAKGNRIRFRAKGVSVRVVSSGAERILSVGNGRWQMRSEAGSGENYMLSSGGGLTVYSPGTNPSSATFDPGSAAGRVEGFIDAFDNQWTPSPKVTFEFGLKSVRSEYRKWLGRMPDVSPDLGAGAELAAYVNWSSVVPPKGFLDRSAMLMSKNWMARVWAWDHCFNAMALTPSNRELAWSQFMIPIDNQEPSGALPDTTRELIKETQYSKPPIHGWALAWMMQRGAFKDKGHLTEVYGPLVKWTEFYFRNRDQNHNGFPEYPQGCDSGWDNSTVFSAGVPMETPDLCGYLVLQMDALATVARTLGKKQEAQEWGKRSDRLLKGMLSRFWRNDHFVAIRVDTGADVECDSLLLYMPLLLGKKLPPNVSAKMIAGLAKQGRFRTPNGYASEPPGSNYYEADGYWRGPVWAPTSMLLAEGMDSIDESELAHRLRLDFCTMAQRSGTMAENFDAVTGAGLRDCAYTWTSSVYLIFAHRLWLDRSRN
jgi:putative isomerase